MYSGENVVILSPDGDNLSILQAALIDDKPDASIPKHARFAMGNGGVRRLEYVVKPSELLVTGQTHAEADATFRKMKALRVAGEPVKTEPDTWLDIWKLSVDNNR